MKKGFTLIELLVVISIIGILAGLTLTGFAAARKNARDTQRKSDLAQYKAALEAYASNNNGNYVNNQSRVFGNGVTDGSNFFTSCATCPIIPAYLPSVILPPINDTTNNYLYRGNGIDYVLQANLETGGVWTLCSNGKAGKAAAENGGNNFSCPF